MDKQDTVLSGTYADDIITADIKDIDLSTFTINVDDTIDLTSMAGTGAIGTNSLNYNYGNVTISNGNSGFYNTTSPMYNIGTVTKSGLSVSGDAEIDGDIKWRGRSLGKMLEDIEKRLAILVPDPEKLEHFESLRKAYEHYKTLEALCEVPKKSED